MFPGSQSADTNDGAPRRKQRGVRGCAFRRSRCRPQQICWFKCHTPAISWAASVRSARVWSLPAAALAAC